MAFTTDLIITRQGVAVKTQRDDDDEDEETGGAQKCALQLHRSTEFTVSIEHNA